MSTLQRYDLERITDGGTPWRAMDANPAGHWVRYEQVAQLVADLKLLTDAAAKTPCVGPEDPANVAAWIQGAARQLGELGAKVDLLTTLLAQRDQEAQDTLAEAVKVEEDRNRLRQLVRTLFERYLDVVEESDSGREFRPTTIGTCRAAQAEPLGQLLLDLRVAVGLPPPKPLNAPEDEPAEDLEALRANLQRRIGEQCGRGEGAR